MTTIWYNPSNIIMDNNSAAATTGKHQQAHPLPMADTWSGPKKWQRKGSSKGPLRDIVTIRTVAGRDYELLECGHLIQPCLDHQAPTPRRRRCAKCKAGAPADVDAAHFFPSRRERDLIALRPPE